MGGNQSKSSRGNATLAGAIHGVPGIVQRLDNGDSRSLTGTSREVRDAAVRHHPATLEVTVDSLRALVRRPEQLGDVLTVNYDGLCVPAGDAGKLLAALEGCNMGNLEAAGNPADHVRAMRRVLERSIQNLTPLHVVSLHLDVPLPGMQSGGAGMAGFESELVALRQVICQLQQATGRQATQVVFEAFRCTVTTRATAEAFEVVRLTGWCSTPSLTGVLGAHHGTLEELDVTGAFDLDGDYWLPVPAEVVSAWGDLWRWIGRARNLRVLRLAQSGMTPNLVDNPSFQECMVDALLACEQLEVLQLQYNVLPEAVITQIMPRLVTLRELRLRSCGISDEVAEVLAAGLTEARGGTLRVLDLNNVYALGGAGRGYENAFNLAAALPSLARLLRCGRLEELHLSGVGLTDGGASSLAEAIEDESCKLRVLDVSNNNIQDGAALGAAIGASRTLEVVNLDGNFIGDEGLSAIGRGLHLSKSIRELFLCRRPYAALSGPWTEGARSLGGGLRRTRSLRVLRIDGFSFQPADYAAILDGLAANSSVEVMSMYYWVGNTVDDRVARMVADMLRRNRTLRSLNMLWENVTTRGLAAIGSALRSGNETLQYLSVKRDEDGRCPLRLAAVRNSKGAAFARWVALASWSVWAFLEYRKVTKVLKQQHRAAPRGRGAAGNADGTLEGKDTPAPVQTSKLVTAARVAGMVGVDAGLTVLENHLNNALIRGLMAGRKGPTA
ncbi:unnamed protein product [Pedinophyceae sp. YPF-701]|nr:unnamed protein product [Pedinophyceae sp. YPF-701]